MARNPGKVIVLACEPYVTYKAFGILIPKIFFNPSPSNSQSDQEVGKTVESCKVSGRVNFTC